MTTSDTPEAALVAMTAALESVDVRSGYRLSSMTPPMGPTTLAAAVLAALPPGWCGHDTMLTQQEAEDMGRHAAQQAVAAERARIVRETEWLQVRSPSDDEKPGWYWDGWHAAIAAVLAIVEGKP